MIDEDKLRKQLGPLPPAHIGTHKEQAAERLRGLLRLNFGIDITDILDVLDTHEKNSSDGELVCRSCGICGHHTPECQWLRVTTVLRKMAHGPSEGGSKT